MLYLRDCHTLLCAFKNILTWSAVLCVVKFSFWYLQTKALHLLLRWTLVDKTGNWQNNPNSEGLLWPFQSWVHAVCITNFYDLSICHRSYFSSPSICSWILMLRSDMFISIMESISVLFWARLHIKFKIIYFKAGLLKHLELWSKTFYFAG